MITLYVYNLRTRCFEIEIVGDINTVLLNIKDGFDYTLEKPPDYHHKWRWVDNKWITDETSL